MSELAKRIGRIQRREVSGGMGFGATRREQPRAMLLAVTVATSAEAKTAVASGADIAILTGPGAAAAIKGLDKVCAGAQLDTLDEAAAAALRQAGCDFVISPLETTASAAVDTDAMGQVVAIADSISDATLRALGPLGLDALFVPTDHGTTTLAAQLELVRFASLSGLPLAVPIAPGAAVPQLRVLRDSGVAMVIAAAGANAEQIKALVDSLKAVPAPKKGSKGGDMAIVPSIAQRGGDEDDDDDDDGEE